jgi:hypothetical protein
MALFVLQKYYRLSKAVPAYAAAVLLDPSKRKSYMTGTWDLPDMRRVINQAQEIWGAEYKNRSVLEAPRLPTATKAKPPKENIEESVFDKIRDELVGLKLNHICSYWSILEPVSTSDQKLFLGEFGVKFTDYGKANLQDRMTIGVH